MIETIIQRFKDGEYTNTAENQTGELYFEVDMRELLSELEAKNEKIARLEENQDFNN